MRWLGLACAISIGFSVAPISAVGCGDSVLSSPDAGSDGGEQGGADGGEKPVVVVLHPDAAPLPGETKCEVVITTGITPAGATHVPVCTPVDYPTNPPSGGDHWPVWAAYKAYTSVVPREMYVHDMEHGGVILLYRCAGDCPEVVDLLGKVMEGAEADPLCGIYDVHARLVLTPDPELDVPVAAGAWGATYTATCLDEASLADFVAKRYGRGSEDTCAPGFDVENPDGGSLCGQGGAGTGGADGGG